MDVVPFPIYTRSNGYHNLAAHWPDSRRGVSTLKPDLGKGICLDEARYSSHSEGPKMYVATHDDEERGSTPLHLDATAAVNILVYTGSEQPQRAGALWHIFAPEDCDKIRAYLHGRGLYPEDRDPIHARQTYVNAVMRADLQDLQVVPYEIYQKVGDAVMIPAGCAHQVCTQLFILPIR